MEDRTIEPETNAQEPPKSQVIDTRTLIFSHSKDLNKLFEALSKAQGQMTNPKTNAENPFFSSKYATLAEVVKVISQPLADNNLCLTQWIVEDRLLTMLGHSSGQFIKAYKNILVKDKTAHGEGSGITYSRRYMLMAVCGLAPEDDDGNVASGKGTVFEDAMKKLLSTNAMPHLENTFKKNSGSWQKDFNEVQMSELLILKDAMKLYHQNKFDIRDHAGDKVDLSKPK